MGGRYYFCTRCGEPAAPVPGRLSLDDRYAIGRCKACGEVAAVEDRDAALAILRRRREDKARRDHLVHLRDGARPHGCEACHELARSGALPEIRA